MILGTACKYVIKPNVIVALDPYDNELGSVVFTNADAAEKFADAARACALSMSDEFAGFASAAEYEKEAAEAFESAQASIDQWERMP